MDFWFEHTFVGARLSIPWSYISSSMKSEGNWDHLGDHCKLIVELRRKNTKLYLMVSDSFMNLIASKNVLRQSLVANNYIFGWVLKTVVQVLHTCISLPFLHRESTFWATFLIIFCVAGLPHVSWSDSQCPLKTTISVSLHAGSSWFGATYSGWSGSQQWIPSREHGAG